MKTSSVLLVYLIQNFLLPGFYGAHVQFFRNFHYSDLLFERSISGNCSTVPDGRKFVSSIKTDTCLIIYESANCRSHRSWRQNPNDKMIEPITVGSFQSCYDEKGRSQLHVDITSSTQNRVFESYRDICSCRNFPPDVLHYELWSIDNHANDLLVFYELGCAETKRKARKIPAGHSYTSADMMRHLQVEKDQVDYYDWRMFMIRSFAPVPGYTRKCGIMENELFELSNYTGQQNSDLIDPMTTTARLRRPKPQFFRESNFQGFLFETYSTAECTNLPKPNEPTFVTDEFLSIKTDSCIMVYSSYNCSGRSLKLEPIGSYNLTKNWESTITGPQTIASLYNLNPNWKWYTKSFNICTAVDSRLNVDITEYQGEDEQSKIKVFERYRDICNCQNIPNHVKRLDKWSINAFGNSLVAYFEDNCGTDVSNSLWIPAGRSSFTIGLGSFKQEEQISGAVRKIRSIGPDPDTSYFQKNCAKFFSTIIKFEIDEPTESHNEQRNVSMMATKTVFRNESPSQLTQTYSASQTVRESVQVDAGKSFSKMNSVHVDQSVDIETRRHEGSAESKSTGSNTGWTQSRSSSRSSSQGIESRESESRSTHQSSDTRDTTSVGASHQTTVGAEAGGEFLGLTAKASVSTSVGVNVGHEQSTTNTRGRSSGSERSQSVSASRTSGQEMSSGLSGGSTEGRENSANYFKEDGFKQSLRKAYENSGTLSSSSSKSSTIENTKSFQVTQTISVPPCTEQVVHASVKVVTNKRVEYRAISKISGQLSGRQMTSAELRRFMNRGLQYIADFDEYTVMAYATGTFTAEYGVSSIINSQGSIIVSCLKQLNGCPLCQTCTNDCIQQASPVSTNMGWMIKIRMSLLFYLYLPLTILIF